VDALTSPLDPLRAEHGAGHDFTPVAGVLKTSAIDPLPPYDCPGSGHSKCQERTSLGSAYEQLMLE
jgi:hypothetical protein